MRSDRTLCAALLALAAAIGACGPEEPVPAPAPRPPSPPPTNVVLVTIDSLRADHLGAYGYARATSPNLDRLAAEGTLFEAAVAQAPWTLPSLASLLTSRLPAETGAIHMNGALRKGSTTAGVLFRAAGHATGGFTCGAYTEPSRGFDRGFDVYRNLDRTHRGAELNRLALEWLDGLGERPFFLWIHYFDVHADYAAPAPWNALFDDTPPAPEEARIGHLMRVVNGDEAMAPGELARIATSYDREIAYVDAMLGELWQALERRGLAARTALVVGADHGEGLMEHGLLLHTLSVHREFVRVPLVLRLPGKAPAGRRVAAQVRNLDVLPTLLAIAGIAAPPDLRGRSLLPLARGERGVAPAPAPVHTDTTSHEAHYSRQAPIRAELFDALFAVGTIEAKLVYSSKQDRYRLYDLAADPWELRDVFAEKGAAHPELRRAVDELRALAPPPPGDAPAAAPTPAELEQLRALGYAR
jgi:arylsulfatase A-like enzyme